MEKIARIKDLIIRYRVVYRPIKNPRIEFKTGEMLLIVPPEYKDPEALIVKHSKWIYQNIKQIRIALHTYRERQLNYHRTDEEFKRLVRSYVRYATKKLDVKINRIFFRTMVSKWASCSINKNLKVNNIGKYLPKELIRYIIYHEVAHILEKKHNERFWDIIASIFPDYQQKEAELLDYWLLLNEEKKNRLERISLEHGL